MIQPIHKSSKTKIELNWTKHGGMWAMALQQKTKKEWNKKQSRSPYVYNGRLWLCRPENKKEHQAEEQHMNYKSADRWTQKEKVTSHIFSILDNKNNNSNNNNEILATNHFIYSHVTITHNERMSHSAIQLCVCVCE